MNEKQKKGIGIIVIGLVILFLFRYIPFIGRLSILGLPFLILGVLQIIGIIDVDKFINKNGDLENDFENNLTNENMIDTQTNITNTNQTNKIVNVTLKGGIIGMLADSPQNTLNRRIRKENSNGWKVIQVIPASSGNILLLIFRIVLLVITVFLFTTANGYYIIMEKK